MWKFNLIHTYCLLRLHLVDPFLKWSGDANGQMQDTATGKWSCLVDVHAVIDVHASLIRDS